MKNENPTPILGKIIGGAIGLVLGFGPIGLIIGILIGHYFDRKAAGYYPYSKGEAGHFFAATFQVLGHLAKLDGHISEAEINYTQKVMSRLRLSRAQREQAMKLFYDGKDDAFNLDACLEHFKHDPQSSHRSRQVFLNFLTQLAYVEGAAKPEIRRSLVHIAQYLGLPPVNFAYYDAIFAWQQQAQNGWQQQRQGGGQQYSSFGGGQSGYSGYGGSRTRTSGFGLNTASAHRELGLSQGASQAEVKRAYRKLMSKYHPDKLMSKDLSDDELKKATEKAQKIKASYEMLKTA